MRFNGKKHMTKKQLSQASGLSYDALSVRAKIDPAYPEALFVGNGYDIVYDKGKALEWLDTLKSEEVYTPQVAQPRTSRPLREHGEYKPSDELMINLRRASELYSHSLYTPKGVGLTHDNPNYRTY